MPTWAKSSAPLRYPTKCCICGEDIPEGDVDYWWWNRNPGRAGDRVHAACKASVETSTGRCPHCERPLHPSELLPIVVEFADDGDPFK